MTEAPLPPDRSSLADRDAVLAMLVETMDLVHARIADSDPETTAEERTLIQLVKAEASIAGQYRRLLHDADLDAIHDRLELLEADGAAT